MNDRLQDPPSASEWLAAAKSEAGAKNVGMYLLHNGVVRSTPKAAARFGQTGCPPVTGMEVSCDRGKLEEIKKATLAMEGVEVARVWIQEGSLSVGDDLMYVLIGGDIRPHVIGALEYMVSRIKSECIREKELF